MDILTLKEAADYLKISENMLRKMVKDEQNPIPHKKLGRIYRFLKEELQEYMRGIEDGTKRIP